VVKVLPFGLEKPYGERVFKITEFKDGKFQILLHATNSLLHKTAVQGITITEVLKTIRKNLKIRQRNYLSHSQELLQILMDSQKSRELLSGFLINSGGLFPVKKL
jgi:hypothetical protein